MWSADYAEPTVPFRCSAFSLGVEVSKTESVRSPANAHSGSAPSAQVLSGWKDIANYLAKGVRTVQRYERDFGLPVRRPAGKPSASVMAVKLELDRWIISRPHRLPVSSSSTASSLGSSDKALKNTFAEMD